MTNDIIISFLFPCAKYLANVSSSSLVLAIFHYHIEFIFATSNDVCVIDNVISAVTRDNDAPMHMFEAANEFHDIRMKMNLMHYNEWRTAYSS